MTPWHQETGGTVYHGNCLNVMAGLAPNSVDTIITDPPYHLTTGKAGGTGAASLNPNSPAGRSRIGTGFMGKAWDGGDVAFRPETWAAALRVAKPGAFLLAFGGTRTFHRLTCAIEDAGWEIRDCMSWLYGSGFPKSLDIGKAIDKRPGVSLHEEFRRDLADARKRQGLTRQEVSKAVVGTGSGACWNWEHHQFPETRHWSALKATLPALPDKWAEVLAEAEREVVGKSTRPPGWFTSGDGHDLTAPATDAARRWNGWGTALKPAWEPIVVAMKPLSGTFAENALTHGVAGLNIDGSRIASDARPLRVSDRDAGNNTYGDGLHGSRAAGETTLGRWPANVLLDEVAASALDAQTGTLTSGEPAGVKAGGKLNCYGTFAGGIPVTGYGDSGGASRFFYTAKASRSDRGHGNDHPTVKPTDLLKYLCKLTATPTGGVVLDPFAGSGTTLVAAREYGRPFIGIELEEAHCRIIVDRLRQGVLFAAGA